MKTGIFGVKRPLYGNFCPCTLLTYRNPRRRTRRIRIRDSHIVVLPLISPMNFDEFFFYRPRQMWRVPFRLFFFFSIFSGMMRRPGNTVGENQQQCGAGGFFPFPFCEARAFFFAEVVLILGVVFNACFSSLFSPFFIAGWLQTLRMLVLQSRTLQVKPPG